MMPNTPGAPGAGPAATPAPLHDIAGPIWFFPYPVWMAIAAGVLLVAILVLIGWLIARRKPRSVSLRERALKALGELRVQIPNARSYEFGVRVSDVLRGYIRDQRGLDAVNRTSIEFLETLRTNDRFTDNEKAALSDFLTHVDLLKYARQNADADQMNSLVDTAERVVKNEAPIPEEAPAP
jgi:hypothetical protein